MFAKQCHCHVLTSMKSDVVPYHNPILPLLADVELDDDNCMISWLISAVHISPLDTTGDGIMDDLDPDIYPHAKNSQDVFALSSKERRCIITPAILSKRWYISLEAAHDTLNVTTQARVCNVYLSAERKVRKKAASMPFPNLVATFYVDSLFSSINSQTNWWIHFHGVSTNSFHGLRSQGTRMLLWNSSILLAFPIPLFQIMI
jgi:hypothetical protein